MDHFLYRNGRLHCEEVPVDEAVEAHGTPLYLYSIQTILDHARSLKEAFLPAVPEGDEPLIAYSVKANSNLSILRLMREEGCGFDVVSGGELFRALRAGGDPSKIVFAGVGKTQEDFRAGLENDILLFNVESEAELEELDAVAGRMGRRAPVALRVNPDVDPRTHRYISTGKKETKFGIDLDRAGHLLDGLGNFKNIDWKGIHCHIGSQITDPAPYVEALERISAFIEEARGKGRNPEWIDVGGGFGIWYQDRNALPAKRMASSMVPILKRLRLRLILEPGRFIVGNAGILLTRVIRMKTSGEKRFLICDAGMNDLIRPTLYGAYHHVWPVLTAAGTEGSVPTPETAEEALSPADVVGPICETGDYFAQDRPLPGVEPGALLSVFSAGAYGSTMASNYNSQRRPAEAAVFGSRLELVTERETSEDLIRRERVVSFDAGE